MKDLRILMKWDLLLLQRNNLFLISLLIAAIYTGIFYLLSDLGQLSNLLVVLVFNDPVVTGFMFAGIIWMFDLNQNTLKAFSVLPVPIDFYYWSKVVILALLALLVALVMTVAAIGLHFKWIHLIASVVGASWIFINLGFLLGARAGNFNRFLGFTVPAMMMMAFPFLALFEVLAWYWFIPFPSAGSLFILKAAVSPAPPIPLIISYLQMATWGYFTCRITIAQLKRSIS